MTARPNPMNFAPQAALPAQTMVMMRPQVRDHYWGYEVRANELVINAAVLLRALCGFVAVATVVAALGVWLVPAMAFVAAPFLTKAVVSALLLCVSVLLSRQAARGTRVRVQIDTAEGELREVVDGPFGSVVIVAKYGFDAIDAVDVVASLVDPSFGQIQVRVKDAGLIAVGDGAIVTLGPLRNRLIGDFGVEQRGVARPAIWTGPLAA